MTTRTLVAAAAITLATATTLGITSPANADETPDFNTIRAQLHDTVDTDIITAMQRDLDLTADAAYDTLAIDQITTDIADIAATRYGSDYAGTWVADNRDGAVVAVTDPALTDDITALGATPVIVDRSLADLNADKETLDAVTDVPDSVHTWAVDITTNRLTVGASDRTAAQSFIDDAGVKATIVDAQQPETLADIVGGDAYYINNSSRCSIGFPVTYPGGSGFVSAGHCGSPGDYVASAGQSNLGQFEQSTFPGSDYSWVSANSGWTAVPRVNGYGQASITVTDGNQAATGASVCRSGSTTGLHCGQIGAKNQTVRYPQGTVYGMTQTNVCAEPGDSGGSWISGGSAQGVTSGGSGNCTSGGVTYFFPLTTILQAYPSLTLATG